MGGLTHVYIPIHILRLGIKGIAEVLILALAASFGDKGLCMSNTRLAECLGISRRNIVAAVGRLKKRGLVCEHGGRGGRRLIASPQIAPPACSDEKTPAEVTKHLASGVGSSHTTEGTEGNLTLYGKPVRFAPPTLEEVAEYIKEKNLCVDAATFHQYFTESGWVDSRGRKVRNWKQKAITWHSHGKGKTNGGKGDGIVRSFRGLRSRYGQTFGGNEPRPPVPLRRGT
jgi:biotin operon repressor